MATVQRRRRTQTEVVEMKRPKGPSHANSIGLSLPSVKTPAEEDMGKYTYLIHGDPGVGKTSFGIQFPKALLMSFEPGGKSHEVYRVDVPDWKHFLGYIELIESNPRKFRTVVIDTGFLAYERCFEEVVLKRLGLTDPNDKGWGSAWKMVDAEFREAHVRLSRCVGIVILAHSEVKELKKKIGKELVVVGEKLKMQLGTQASRLYSAIVDVAGYYQMDHSTGRRLLHIVDTDLADGKNRIKNHFLDADGRYLHEIDMGGSEEEAFKNFSNAFANKYRPPRRAHKK